MVKLGGDKINLNNPEELAEALDNARAFAFWDVKRMADIFISRREACRKRGYHRVDEDPRLKEGGEDLGICYDCEVWFRPSFQPEVKYKFEPL